MILFAIISILFSQMLYSFFINCPKDKYLGSIGYLRGSC